MKIQALVLSLAECFGLGAALHLAQQDYIVAAWAVGWGTMILMYLDGRGGWSR